MTLLITEIDDHSYCKSPRCIVSNPHCPLAADNGSVAQYWNLSHGYRLLLYTFALQILKILVSRLLPRIVSFHLAVQNDISEQERYF